MALTSVLLIAASVPLLYLGAAWLVDNAAELGRRAGVSTLLVGLTVVAFGTSTPELVVSLLSAAAGQAEVAVGNALGSNLFNIGVVLSAGALLAPLAVAREQIAPHGLALFASAFVFLFAALDGTLSAVEGAAMLLTLAVFLAASYKSGATGRMEVALPPEALERGVPGAPPSLVLGGILVGLLFLVVGAQALVTGAVELAEGMGVTPRVVGLTIVAAGTSLPELATTVVAAGKKQADIALGNVVGSNIFNILGILGASAAIFPLAVHPSSLVDFTVMLGFTAALLAFSRSGGRITRPEGAALLGGYLVYLAWLLAA